MNRIDDLLSQPLPPVADDGFSARVMGRIAAARRRRQWTSAALMAAGVLAAVLLLPLPTIGEALGSACRAIADTTLTAAFARIVTSGAINFALATVAVSLLLERGLSRL